MGDFYDKLKFNCDGNECFIGSKTDPGRSVATGITDVNFAGSVKRGEIIGCSRK